MRAPDTLARSFSLRRTLRRGRELAEAGLAGPADESLIDRAGGVFPVAVTAHLADTMADEPAVARQFVPEAGEFEPGAHDRADPIGDDALSPLKGIVHRYPDRVLLKPLLACPAYCRFCFRRDSLGGPDAALGESELEAAFAYIAGRPAVWEVILSGGDPLMLPAKRLAAIINRLSAMPHVKVIRVHTRVPVLDPTRVTGELVAALETERALFVALHCNHAAELTEAARAACRRIVKSGIPMLSQSVLLRGVNDDPGALESLMRALVECRIKPYYLHHPDLAPGTAHFRLPVAEGQALVRGLRGRVSGLAQPTYVLDIPGGHGKVPVGPAYIANQGSGHVVEDWQGRTHAYPPPPSAP
ncbi:MAG: lysine-2,3-aminomutase-like protein [Alphaproteobacteria bacterium]